MSILALSTTARAFTLATALIGIVVIFILMREQAPRSSIQAQNDIPVDRLGSC